MTLVSLGALVVVTLACMSLTATSLVIGTIVFPETGHLNPMLAIIEAAAISKGHTTVIFGPSFFMHSCERETMSLPSARCVDLGFYDKSMVTDEFMQQLIQKTPIESLSQVSEHVNDYNRFLVTSLKKKIEELSLTLDVLLVDFGAWSGTAVGDVLGIPSVMIWPLTLQFPLELNPSIPALGSELSLHMTLKERIVNYIIQRAYLVYSLHVTEKQYNEIRALVGAPPVDIFNLYYKRFIITPSIYGLDLSQPLCPNVHPVGFLTRIASASDISSAHVPEEWQTYLDECTDGLVYINMGSVAVLPDSWLHKIESAAVQIAKNHGMCVVWKLTRRQQQIVTGTKEAGRHIRLTNHLPFSPRLLLAHKNTKVFVTHCGDTSVYESVHNAVPMVGIPLFADQSDMCARVSDAKVGIALNKLTFTNESLYQSVMHMSVNDRDAAQARLVRLRNMGIVLGGAPRAAELVERIALNADILDMFFCEHPSLPWYQRHDADVIAITSFILAVVVLTVWYVLKCLFRCCCGSRSTKVKRE